MEPQNKNELPIPSEHVKGLINQAALLMKDHKKEDAHDLLKKKLVKSNKKDKIAIYVGIFNLFQRSDEDVAIDALDSIREIDGNLTFPLLFKAYFYEKKRQIKKSISLLKEMMTLEPTNRELVDAARILSRYGEQTLALIAAKKAYLSSGEDITLATYPLRVAIQNADWDFAEGITAKLLKAYQEDKFESLNETPRTHLLWCDDEGINFNVIKKFAKNKFKNITQAPLANVPEGDFTKRKVRIGYLSNDFRDHPTSYLAMGLLRHHNKSRFEIFIYDTSFDDGKAMRRQIFSRANLVRDISKQTDPEAASLIFKDKIDVLVDLNGLTEGTRLGIFAYRPAPVQISYLGFPGTTGTTFVDYIIADDYTLPTSSEPYCSESVIRIPNTYQINDYIAQYLAPLPALRACGLPVGKKIIGMFNNVNKVGRDVWYTWMNILNAIPDAVLWMLDPGDLAKENLLASAKLQGIDSDRFFWAKKIRLDDHLARIAHCSIILDPWPYGGHTTTSDALFAGVPVIALEGKNFASRVSGGLIKAAGLQSLIAKDKNEYIKLVTKLLNDHKLLLNVKYHLYKNRRKHPVFDAVSKTLYIEVAFLHALNLADKKSKPISFNVSNQTREKRIKK